MEGRAERQAGTSLIRLIEPTVMFSINVFATKDNALNRWTIVIPKGKLGGHSSQVHENAIGSNTTIEHNTATTTTNGNSTDDMMLVSL